MTGGPPITGGLASQARMNGDASFAADQSFLKRCGPAPGSCVLRVGAAPIAAQALAKRTP